MKKCIILCFLWLSILSLPIYSEPASITYKIIYDSSMKNVIEIHEEVLQKTAKLFAKSSQDSYETLMKAGYTSFTQSDRVATYNNHQLTIIVGDGKGSVVEGNLNEEGVCLPKVKPKSIFMEWLNLD